jgi:hypothetical protein
MHLGIQRPSSGSIAQRCDGFPMTSLLREGNSEIERGNRIIGASLENDSKGALGIREPSRLQEFPPGGEGGVEILCMVIRATLDRGGDERSQTHAPSQWHPSRQSRQAPQLLERERLDSPQTLAFVPQ